MDSKSSICCFQYFLCILQCFSFLSFGEFCNLDYFISYAWSFSWAWLLHFFSVLARNFCSWLEFNTLTDVCSICVPVNIHNLLYYCISLFKTYKEILFLAIVRTLQNLCGILLLAAFFLFFFSFPKLW